MPAKHSRRGRPKGSGLDDTPQLKSIAELMAADPALKPTTAIRSMGISDPSTIRRLRDKYRKFSTNLENTKNKFDHQPKASVKTSVGSVRTDSQPAPQMPTQRAHIQASRQPSTVAESTLEPLSEPALLFESWCGLSLQTMSTTFEINLAAYTTFVALRPVTLALRQQAILNDLAIAFYKKQKPLPAYVH